MFMEALTDNGVGSANYVSYNAFTAGIMPTGVELEYADVASIASAVFSRR